jgi:hypothetical protein
MKKLLIGLMALCLPMLVLAEAADTTDTSNYIQIQGQVTNSVIEWQASSTDWSWQPYTIEASAGTNVLTWVATVETTINVPTYSTVISTNTRTGVVSTNVYEGAPAQTIITTVIGDDTSDQPFDYAMTRRSLLKVVFSVSNAVFRIVGIKL